MAINFTVSYTFSPSTTISSSQVNTNTTDNASVWQGLEALTKTFAKLKVDVDPTTALEVATKQYVDHYSAYRRPVLQFGSVTTVAVESGLDGTSGDIPLLFPDGSLRTETSTTRTTFNITRNAVLVTSGAQSGLTGATSEAANTWYSLYGVKITDSSTQWVTVGSTVSPTQANYATLNTAYGTNGWVYLGTISNGDEVAATSDIAAFVQAGPLMTFKNGWSGGNSTAPMAGRRMATTASATSLTWSYTNGSTAGTVPTHFSHIAFGVGQKAGTATQVVSNSSASIYYTYSATASGFVQQTGMQYAAGGCQISNSGASAAQYDIAIYSFYDGVLGVGSNPLL